MRDPLAPRADHPPSPLDRLDPRTRILAAGAAVVVTVTLRDPVVLAGALAATVLMSTLAGVGLRDLLERLAHVEGFLIVLVLLLPLTVPGDTAFALGPLPLSRPGLDRALLVLLRVNLAAVTIFVLLAGLEPARLGHGLARLGAPEKLVHVFLFAVRWVDQLREETARLRDALRARAFVSGTSRHTLRTWGNFAGTLLVRSFERAERVDEAMRCRGFAGRFLLVDDAGFGPADRLFGLLLAAVLLGALVLDRLP